MHYEGKLVLALTLLYSWPAFAAGGAAPSTEGAEIVGGATIDLAASLRTLYVRSEFLEISLPGAGTIEVYRFPAGTPLKVDWVDYQHCRVIFEVGKVRFPVSALETAKTGTKACHAAMQSEHYCSSLKSQEACEEPGYLYERHWKPACRWDEVIHEACRRLPEGIGYLKTIMRLPTAESVAPAIKGALGAP